MNQSEQINELATALSKAQASIGPAIKDSYNPFFKSKYADLSSVWAACKEPLTKNGLAVVQTMSAQEGKMFLITTLTHSSGQWMSSTLPICPMKNDPQGLGSAITYLRRYSLASITGVTTDDDDGQSASTPPSRSSESSSSGSIIGVSKGKELKGMLDQCDIGYQSNFWVYLKKKVPGIHSLENLPASLYEQVNSSLKKKVDALVSEDHDEAEVAYA